MTISSNQVDGAAPRGALERIERAPSAEAIFDILELAYDPRVLNVARLHILRRLGEYVRREDFSGLTEERQRARCRELLARAYDEFVTSSPLDRRVFKVLKQAVTPGRKGNFVAFDELLK